MAQMRAHYDRGFDMMKLTVSAGLAALIAAGSALADGGASRGRLATFEVTVTNITSGVTFTPTLAVTHTDRVRLFEAGAPASPELADLAESGNVAPLAAQLAADAANVTETTASSGLLGPGQSLTLVIQGVRGRDRLSLAAMLLPTNDSFYALNAVTLPDHGAKVLTAPGYDAGSETNDELCANIPGPMCGGIGVSPPSPDDQGFVHISSGIHGQGDLSPATYDWRNPVARIVVRRVR
jgi:hypothetical protein